KGCRRSYSEGLRISRYEKGRPWVGRPEGAVNRRTRTFPEPAPRLSAGVALIGLFQLRPRLPGIHSSETVRWPQSIGAPHWAVTDIYQNQRRLLGPPHPPH